MTLKDALLDSSWDAFENSQGESWNVSDTVYNPDNSEWMGCEVVVENNQISELDDGYRNGEIYTESF